MDRLLFSMELVVYNHEDCKHTRTIVHLFENGECLDDQGNYWTYYESPTKSRELNNE